MSDMTTQLSRPFDVNKIRWRIGATSKDKTSGIALAYLDARDVMERLDEVCGAENWQAIYDHVTANGVVCRLGIRCDGDWVWKSNGAGETAVEAEKGALSDAFKRAAVLWGVGRYLYALENIWVNIEPRGKSYIIAKGQQDKLKNALNTYSETPEIKAISYAKNTILPKLKAADDKPSVLDAYADVIERMRKYPKAMEVLKDYVSV